MKTTNKAAYLRGQRLAIQWKQLVKTLRRWDNFWVHAARKNTCQPGLGGFRWLLD